MFILRNQKTNVCSHQILKPVSYPKTCILSIMVCLPPAAGVQSARRPGIHHQVENHLLQQVSNMRFLCPVDNTAKNMYHALPAASGNIKGIFIHDWGILIFPLFTN